MGKRMSTVSGIKAEHAIITPKCREGWGPQGAFDEAVRRLKKEYSIARSYEDNEQANFHLVLTIERPESEDV